ncbi:MAG: ATP-binding cassette domain-containing protein [Roseburia sp.]|nr:ATP-binding cassette domain-containing protein [Roseburia sp.]MCM1278617.1 ATP-binding cassette domain-containing protein [Robinsoniella sp.]
MKQTKVLNKKHLWRKLGIILFWLFIWQGMQLVVANPILLAGPLQVAQYLCIHILRADFWQVVLLSVMRIGMGFLLAFFMGILLGAVSFRFPFIKELLAPVIGTLKAIPVASFVVLLLIWFGSGKLSYFCSFLVAFPNVYESILTGLAHLDDKRQEMLEVYQVSFPKKVVYLYMPAVFPYLINSCKTCIGMSMKSGVAAEVIGTPEFSIGERIYMAKIYLDTPGVLGWTLVVIAISFLLEKGFLWLLAKAGKAKWFLKGKRQAYDNSRQEKSIAFTVEGVSKSYGSHTVLEDFNLQCTQGEIYCITGPSGIGKTTLLKILAGTEGFGGGRLSPWNQGNAMVFQECRLSDDLSAIENVMLTAGRYGNLTRETAKKELLKLLPEDSLNKPVSQLSGGMRRRVELVRAVAAGGKRLLLDEPFSGLDEENKEKAMAYIRERKEGKIVIITTHSKEECLKLGGVLVVL